MYCQFKCKYQMMAYLSLEIELNIGRIYTIYISKKSTLNYYITIPPNKDYDELNILATSPFLKEFKIFISKDHPSSQNTYQVMPSWAGGYMITIDKGSKEYCNNTGTYKGNKFHCHKIISYPYAQKLSIETLNINILL